MGWMHDVLDYFAKDPIYRRWHHHQLTFGMMYQYSEKYLLPFSHDEVVHLKKSMLDKMPGDEWQKRANLRALYGLQLGHPGKKLLFMGSEFGQWREWSEERALDWELLDREAHRGLLDYSCALHQLYQKYAALYRLDHHPDGFQWLDCDSAEACVLSWLRRGNQEDHEMIFILNLTPEAKSYRLPLPNDQPWEVILNSDDKAFGGSGVQPTSEKQFRGEPQEHLGKDHSMPLLLPPLSCIVLACVEKPKKAEAIAEEKTEPSSQPDEVA